VRSLNKPKVLGRIKKEILKVLVRNLNENDLAGLKDLFIFLDRESTGFISA